MSKKPKYSAAAASSFPGVGVTMTSYKHDPFQRPSVPAVKPRRSGRIRRLFGWRRILLAFVILALLVGGWLGWGIIKNSSKIFKGNIFGVLSTQKLKGEDVGRVNILLAGNSADDPGHDGASLTDSIMVVSVDTKNHQATMISVPRDLYVDIPDYGHAKINEAFVDGQNGHFSENGYPDGGMGLLEKVISEDLGININYYALINYNAFRDTVNAVGGIDVTIQSSDPRGLYDSNISRADGGPLKLTNGPHHLDGQTALNLARARGDVPAPHLPYGFPRSDYDRTDHQRMMLIALKQKMSSAGVISNPVKLGNLFNALGNNVKTDFNLSEVRRLYEIGNQIPSNNITSVGFADVNGKSLVEGQMVNGQSVQVPAAGLDDFSDIQQALKQLMSSDPIVRENPTVVVLNGTDTTGLAARVSKQLTDKGVNVAATGDAKSNADKTIVIDASDGSKTASKAYFEKLYKTTATTTNPYKGEYNADFIIVIGSDQIPKSTSSSGSQQ